MKKLMLIGVLLVLVGCSNVEDANRALTGAGFTNIQTDGYAWFACSEDDFYHTKFIATNPQGQTVTGVVCSGFFLKNATIRY